MNRGEEIVAEARLWIGTPYLHQCATRGAGTDCLGLIRGVWRVLVGPEPTEVPPYTQDWAEPSGEEALLAAGAQFLIPRPLTELASGDVILFRMREGSVAKHLGILTEVGRRESFVHAYTAHGVIESPLSAPWKRRIAARFAFPDRAERG
ncbi:NlpC/P60 family protein [Gemmobacter sp. LW-1]|jgi:NlpC/P60 family putative phage cell wall peptidase|uniref:NlpC/P60 family protein n=1 Tax=Gemmobacter sp. LW-1 TaxID=1529005 RepID=UPI0006C76BB4|nr:NlpC/P60 family protein [Gemmobacter sp. LW-1]